MADEQPPAGKPQKKRMMRPAIIAGPAVAIVIGIAVALGVFRGPKAVEPGEGTADPTQLATGAVDPTASVASAPPAPQPVVMAKVEFKDETLTFVANFPGAEAKDPVIAALRKDAESYLAKIKADARASYDSAKKSGELHGFPWEVEIVWSYTAQAAGIVSLLGISSEYEGGAHPTYRLDTYTARVTGERLTLGDMLILKRSPSPAMTIAMCEALKVEKKSKIGSATILDDPIVCVGPKANAHTEEAKIALAPSNQADKFGGVYAYYDPYMVGAYVEGDYKITVQQKIFAEDLKPDFKPLFAGEAPPPEDN